jgi:thiamine-phosphate pyrophosphorylase
MLPPRLHLVTDRRATADLPSAVRSALRLLPPGAAVVHVRAKDLEGAELLALARRVGGICRAAGQLFVVNGRLDVAIASGADGVHLPVAGVPPADARRLLGAALVGVSCHSADEVRRAREGGADYATFGPVFDTPSKRAHGPPVGVAALADAAQLGLPLLALGGVDQESAAVVVAAGAHGVAAIRAWLETPDPGRATDALFAAMVRLDRRARDH